MPTNETTYNIFLSCGSTYTDQQEAFVKSIENYLVSCNCQPKTIGRSISTGRQPVEAARNFIGDCDGMVVIAFERYRILKGIEKPGGTGKVEIKNESHPTIWNQMEAAMAYGQRVPILTLVQKGLKRQGMLSERFEWVAIEVDLSADIVSTEQFRQVFAEWKENVRLQAERKSSALTTPNIDPSNLSTKQIISALSPKHWYVAIAALISAFAFIATAAFGVGVWVQKIEDSASSNVGKPAASSSTAKP